MIMALMRPEIVNLAIFPMTPHTLPHAHENSQKIRRGDLLFVLRLIAGLTRQRLQKLRRADLFVVAALHLSDVVRGGVFRYRCVSCANLS